MEIENNISENLDGQISLFGEEEKSEQTPDVEQELRNVIEEQLSKARTQGMWIGAQTICKHVLDKIIVFERTPGSKSNNDHKRLIKDIRRFCEIGLSRKINYDGAVESAEEDVTE